MNEVKAFDADWRPLIEALCDVEEVEDTEWPPWSDPRRRLAQIRIPGHFEEAPFNGTLNRQTGAFEFVQHHIGEPWDAPWPIVILPWEPKSYGPEDAPIYGYLHTTATFIFSLLRREFDRQIWSLRLKVAGRVGSVLSEPTVLPWDVWSNLLIEDWAKGEARGPAGELVFSLHVARSDAPKRPSMIGDVELNRMKLRSAVASLLSEKLSDAELRELTAKNIWRRIESDWKERAPNTPPPSEETIRRARDEVLARNAAGA